MVSVPDYRIAGLTVRMTCEGVTARQAEAYRAAFAGEPQITVSVSDAAVARERREHPELDEDGWRYLLTGGSFARQLIGYDGFVLHASAIVSDGFAYLFSAPSGGGKTTHTELWLSRLPEAYILNDDKPALRVDAEGRWWVWGTPWSGTSPLNRNEAVPLGGICFLEKGEENAIALADDATASVKLYEQCSKSRRPEEMAALLSLLDRVMSDIPIYTMSCTVDPTAAELSYKTMRRNGK